MYSFNKWFQQPAAPLPFSGASFPSFCPGPGAQSLVLLIAELQPQETLGDSAEILFPCPVCSCCLPVYPCGSSSPVFCSALLNIFFSHFHFLVFLLFLLRLDLLYLFALEFLLIWSFCNLTFNRLFRSVLMDLPSLSCWSIRSLVVTEAGKKSQMGLLGEVLGDGVSGGLYIYDWFSGM